MVEFDSLNGQAGGLEGIRRFPCGRFDGRLDGKHVQIGTVGNPDIGGVPPEGSPILEVDGDARWVTRMRASEDVHQQCNVGNSAGNRPGSRVVGGRPERVRSRVVSRVRVQRYI